MDSDTDFSSDNDYNEFGNQIAFVGNISVFTAAEIQAKKDLAGTSAYPLTGAYIIEQWATGLALKIHYHS